MTQSDEVVRAEERAVSQYQRALQSHFVAQWITSLAISVVCCAILFVVFAGYIVDLHNKSNLTQVRLEVLQERHNQLQSEVMMMRRGPIVQINNPPSQAAAPPAEPQPSSAGVEISEKAPPEPGKVENDFGLGVTPLEPAANMPADITPADPAKSGKAPPRKEPLPPIVR